MRYLDYSQTIIEKYNFKEIKKMANLPSVYKSGSGNIGWPDYLNGRTLSKDSDGFFTVPENGWVWCWTDGDGRFYVRRNGSESILVAVNGNETQASTTLIPVLAGDRVTASKIHDNTMHFFPCL